MIPFDSSWFCHFASVKGNIQPAVLRSCIACQQPLDSARCNDLATLSHCQPGTSSISLKPIAQNKWNYPSDLSKTEREVLNMDRNSLLGFDVWKFPPLSSQVVGDVIGELVCTLTLDCGVRKSNENLEKPNSVEDLVDQLQDLDRHLHHLVAPIWRKRQNMATINNGRTCCVMLWPASHRWHKTGIWQWNIQQFDIIQHYLSLNSLMIHLVIILYIHKFANACASAT